MNGGASKKQNGAPSDAWPTTTATTAEGWSEQVQQAETASAHEDDGGWGDAPADTKETKTTEQADAGGWGSAPAAKASAPAAMGAWGKPRPNFAAATTQAPAPVKTSAPAQAPPKPAAPAPVQEQVPTPAAPAPEPAATAPPASKPKMTWAQIAK